MALLVPAWSKFNPNHIKTPGPYRLPMGSWLGVGTSTRQSLAMSINANTDIFEKMFDHIYVQSTLYKC